MCIDLGGVLQYHCTILWEFYIELWIVWMHSNVQVKSMCAILDGLI